MRAYRDRLSFRALRILLWFDWRAVTVVIGVLYLPFMLLGSFTVAVIGFCLALAAVAWLATVPRIKYTDDGQWYEMESDERAEWVFENRRFPKL